MELIESASSIRAPPGSVSKEPNTQNFRANRTKKPRRGRLRDGPLKGGMLGVHSFPKRPRPIRVTVTTPTALPTSGALARIRNKGRATRTPEIKTQSHPQKPSRKAHGAAAHPCFVQSLSGMRRALRTSMLLGTCASMGPAISAAVLVVSARSSSACPMSAPNLLRQ